MPLSAALMVAGSFLFVALAALVKLASDEASSMQAVLYRSVFSALPVLVMLRVQRLGLDSPRRRMLLLRGALGAAGLCSYMWAVTHAHLADVQTLQQLSPIFVAFLSVSLLDERPRARHWLLAVVCLVGAVMVVRPTRGLASLDASAALLSALFSSLAYVSVRSLTRTEPTARIVFWFSAVATIVALPFVVADWHPLSARAHLLLAGAGLLAAPAQSLMTAAYRHAPAHIAAAFSYATVPLSYAAGLVIWHERPSGWSEAGILLILAAGVAIVVWVHPSRSPPPPADPG